jgi:hypothetical protein
MLKFDNRGYLTPYKAISSTVKEMKEYFVDNIRSETRKKIFEKYVVYSNELKSALGGIPLKQWVNGSFVTKEKNPQDIDLVTFIDSVLVKKHGRKLDLFKSGASWKHYGVDAYIVEAHPNSSEKHELMEYDMRDWQNVFSNNRRDKYGLRTRKGFLEIIY